MLEMTSANLSSKNFFQKTNPQKPDELHAWQPSILSASTAAFQPIHHN